MQFPKSVDQSGYGCKMFLIFSCILVACSWHYAGAACPSIILKKEWDAIKPQHVQYLVTPVDLVIIVHTVTQSCSDDQSCAEVVRSLQKTHVEQAFLWDIGPSFLVGDNGKLYEGRGWHHVAVHTTGYNNQSIAIAFIGNFNNREPSAKALDAVRALIKCGIEENQLSPDYKVVVHSQLISTESPGQKLATKIMSWPDWLKDVSEIKKRADKEEKQVGSNAKSGTGLVLSSPKQIDLLSNLRDVIAELIDNMSKSAHLSLNTIESFTRGMHKEANLFLEALASGMKKLRDKVSAAFNVLPGLPNNKCADSLKKKADTLHDATEAKAKACADKRVNEVDEMIKNLGSLSSESTDFTKTAAQQARNCTELNFGLELSTKICLNSVSRQTESASKTYESQKSLMLESIKTSLSALPAALELCSKKHLLEASTETTKIVSDIPNCATKSAFPLSF